MARRTGRTAALVLAAALTLTGCQDAGDGDAPAGDAAPESAAPSDGAEASAPEDPAAQAVGTGRALLAGYDPEAARAAVEGLDTPEAQQLRHDADELAETLVAWPDNAEISHVFFHSLIVDTDRAFDGDRKEQGYDDYMVTLAEFEAILDQLHAHGYVLVNPEDVAAPGPDGAMQHRPILLPPGKTPLVLSLDDVNYYEYMDGDGFATKLVIDDDGSVVNTYVDAEGREHRGAYDVPPVLDAFVDEHPDFSYRGAKGILAVTGYNGVLGYRTSASQYPDNPDLAADQEAAAQVAEALKADGWVFASHSWGHLNMTTSDLAHLRQDTAMWTEEVQPIVGPTPHLILPFGADISGVPPYAGPKYDVLRQAGFSYFYGVDTSTPHWSQLEDDYLRQARINLDGITFDRELAGRGLLDPFFDVSSVVDPARP